MEGDVSSRIRDKLELMTAGSTLPLSIRDRYVEMRCISSADDIHPS